MSVIVSASDATSAALHSKNDELEGARVEDAPDLLATYRHIAGVHNIIVVIQHLPGRRPMDGRVPL